jgi:hypothetical protein
MRETDNGNIKVETDKKDDIEDVTPDPSYTGRSKLA